MQPNLVIKLTTPNPSVVSEAKAKTDNLSNSLLKQRLMQAPAPPIPYQGLKTNAPYFFNVLDHLKEQEVPQGQTVQVVDLASDTDSIITSPEDDPLFIPNNKETITSKISNNLIVDLTLTSSDDENDSGLSSTSSRTTHLAEPLITYQTIVFADPSGIRRCTFKGSPSSKSNCQLVPIAPSTKNEPIPLRLHWSGSSSVKCGGKTSHFRKKTVTSTASRQLFPVNANATTDNQQECHPSSSFVGTDVEAWINSLLDLDPPSSKPPPPPPLPVVGQEQGEEEDGVITLD